MSDAIGPESSVDIPLDALVLDAPFRKMLGRLGAVLPPPRTVGDLLAVDVREFARQRGIGTTYVDALRQLQELLRSAPPTVDPRFTEAASAADDQSVLAAHAELVICEQGLDEDVAALLRLMRRQDDDQDGEGGITIAHVLRANVQNPRLVRALAQYKRALATACVAPRVDAEGVPVTSLVRPRSGPTYDPHVIERCLIEDLEAFLESLDSTRSVQICRERWGYDADEVSLESLGDRLTISRERVRQLELDLVRDWRRFMRLHPAHLRTLVEPLLGVELATTFPVLSESFRKPRGLIRFLERSAGVDEGTFAEEQWTKEIRGSWLDPLFTETPGTVTYEHCVALLGADYGMSKSQAEQWLTKAIASGTIGRKGDAIEPRALTRKNAFAHVLLEYPSGLPWADAAKIVNRRKITPTTALTTARDRGLESELIWLSDSGTYRHLWFLEREGHDRKAILTLVAEWLRGHGDAANLKTIAEALRSDLPKNVDYYRLRYFVSTNGGEHGIFFQGRSRADTVSLQPITENVTIADAIVARLEASTKPLQKETLASALEITIGHMGVKLDDLADHGRVVRVTATEYTTPQQAFANVDVAQLATRIGDFLKEAGKPVDADAVRERLNDRWGYAYSKYFWLALVKTVAAEKGWTVKRSLVSTGEIPWNGLKDLVRSCSAGGGGQAAILARLAEQVVVTKHVTSTMVATWISEVREVLG